MSFQKQARDISPGDEVTLYQWGRHMTATVNYISSIGMWINVVYLLPGGYRTSRKYDLGELINFTNSQPPNLPF